MDSDTEDSVFKRPTLRCQRLIVNDDSSTSAEESLSGPGKVIGMDGAIRNDKVASNNNEGRPIIDDDIFSDDSGSLEAMLDNLSLNNCNRTTKESKVDEIRIDGEINLNTDEDSLADDDDELISDEDPSSAWTFSKQYQEYYLSKRKVEGVPWPRLCLPSYVFKSLYPHQKTGVQWMAKRHAERIGGILGDDMGMGKTYTTAAFLGSLMRAKTIRNAVIVAPMSVLRSWEKELQRVVLKCVSRAEIQVLDSSLTHRRRQLLLSSALNCTTIRPHIVVTTYGMVSKLQEWIRTEPGYWDYMVLDEAHNVKNSKTQTSLACKTWARNKKTRRLMLTGTPLMNNLDELHSLVDWACSGKVLGNIKRFKGYYARPITAARDRDATRHDIRLGKKVSEELQSVLEPFLLQRLKKDILADLLPPKEEFVVWTHLSTLQRQLYKDFLEKSCQDVIFGEGSRALECITWLKKLCGMPMLIGQTVQDDLKSVLCRERVESLAMQSTKLQVLLDMVPALTAKGHRTLIFSQSTKMLDIIEVTLRFAIGDKIARIDGQTKERDRQGLVDTFNAGCSQFDVMLLSTRAGGVGLTLVGADRVIVYDPDWTSALDAQAVDRCYRIGQSKPIVVYRLISAGTIEEKIYERQVHKEGIKRATLAEGGGSDTVERHIKIEELQEFFTLSERGVAKFMDKVKKEHEILGLHTNVNDHQFVASHPGVVGITRHDALYTGIRCIDVDDDPKPVAAAQSPKILGRAQRVLQKNTDSYHLPVANRNASSGKISTIDQIENLPNMKYSHKAAKQFNQKASKNDDKVDDVDSTIAQARVLKQQQKPRKAFQTLLKHLDTAGSKHGRDEQSQIHSEIVRESLALGLMPSPPT